MLLFEKEITRLHTKLIGVLTLVGILVVLTFPEISHARFILPIKKQPVLPACTIFDYQIFKQIDFSSLQSGETLETATSVERWKKEYDKTVDTIVEEDLGKLTDVDHSPTRTGPPLECTASNYAGLLKPRPNLKILAQKLPTWKVPDNFTALSQEDVGTVLLEYLKMYECALIEWDMGLNVYIEKEEARRAAVRGLIPVIDGFITLTESDIVKRFWEDLSFIAKERQQARETLERTLTLLGGIHRLRPMQSELQCVQQASLDIRNGMALAADASSCLPRIWNAKDPLRDFQIPPP